MSKIRTSFVISGILFLSFAAFTVLVMNFDVQPIGPNGSCVGFARANKLVFEKIGVHLVWYEITDWIGLVAILAAFSFGILGLLQWIRRRSLFKVDHDILALGVFYFIVVVIYAIFETFIVNYRPILLSKSLEASFPSSHAMIIISILGTAMIQFQKRIKNDLAKKALEFAAWGIMILTVVGRMISGVHWFTDIAAGMLLGGALVMLYKTVFQWLEENSKCVGANAIKDNLNRVGNM